MRLLHLLFALLIVTGAAAQNFNFLGDYTADGTPLYLEPQNDVVSPETLQMVSNSLPESFPVPIYNPHYISSGYDTDIIVQEDAEVFVTFVAEGAGYKNVLGFYTYDVNNPLDRAPYDHEITIVFPNVSAKWSGGSLVAGNKVKLGSFEAGTGIGWVLLANAWQSEVTWGLWQLYSNPDFNPEAQEDLRYHNVLLNDPVNERIILGFEDIRRDYGSCDQDFNDALFYISANPYSALETRNYADVDSATKVNSAYDGGLESNGDLSTLIAKRNLKRTQTADHKNTKAAQRKFNKSKFSSKNGNSNLASYFGESALFGTEEATIASPSDLQEITNASSVFAIDYYQGADRVAAGLLLETNDGVYDHTKTICDRLNGSSLEDIRTFQLRGHTLILAKIKRSNGNLEYAVSFSVNHKSNNPTVYSFWNIDQYPEGDYLNFQLWGKSVGQVSALVNYTLDVFEQSQPLAADTTVNKLPQVFVKSGYYYDGKLMLNVQNKTGVTGISTRANIHPTETEALQTQEHWVALSGAYEEQIEITTGHLFDAGIALYDTQNPTYDALYLADGPWGIDYKEEEVYIKDFKVMQPQEETQDAEYLVEREVSVSAEVKGTLNIFRHLLAGELALDVHDLSTLEFSVKANAPIEVILVPAQLEDWSQRLRYVIPATSAEQHFIIPFDAFEDGSGASQSLTAIRSVVFSIQGDFVNSTSVQVDLKNVAFSTNRTLSNEAFQEETQLAEVHNFPNPFTAYTLIKLPEPTNEATLAVIDLSGREVLRKKENPTGNNDVLRLDRNGLSTGMYTYKVTTEAGQTYKGKLLVN